MSKYVGYCRVSTQTQSEKGYGLEAQEREIEKYARAHGIELAQMFRDAGISGNIKDTDDDDAINKREALMEMLSVLEEGDTVIILNTSRLWRSDMTKAIIRRELLKRGAHVYSIEQPKYDIYSKDPNDYLINAIMEALDVYERMSISLKLAPGAPFPALRSSLRSLVRPSFAGFVAGFTCLLSSMPPIPPPCRLSNFEQYRVNEEPRRTGRSVRRICYDSPGRECSRGCKPRPPACRPCR